jgi:hypothetical protein
MNKVKVLFFATLRDRAGRRSAELELPDGATVSSEGATVTAFPDLRPTLSSVLRRSIASMLPRSAPIPKRRRWRCFRRSRG